PDLRTFQADRWYRHGPHPVQRNSAGDHRGDGGRYPDPRRHAQQHDDARARREAARARHVLGQAPDRVPRRADHRRGRRTAARVVDLGAVHGPGRHAEADHRPPRRRDAQGDQRIRNQGSLHPARHRAGGQQRGGGEALPRCRGQQVGARDQYRRREGRAMKQVFAFVLGVTLWASAAAQSWPQKPLRYIVPFPPGAFNDTLARTLAADLPKALGQPVIVENRPGGNTIIATELAAKSPPDGYTLYGAALPFSVIQSLYRTSFDVTKDFAPITLAGVTPNLLVANPGVPFNDVKGLLAFARANPGKLNYASTGNGTSNHLSFELFKAMTGTNVVHVAYKGSAPAVTDLLAGQVQVMFDNTPN